MEVRIPRNKYGKLIKGIKFLNNPKYYKNNIWSWAAWDSCAAQGRTYDSCRCCRAKHYNATLKNKRNSKGKSGSYAWANGLVNLCSECVKEVEKIVDYKFKVR